MAEFVLNSLDKEELPEKEKRNDEASTHRLLATGSFRLTLDHPQEESSDQKELVPCLFSGERIHGGQNVELRLFFDQETLLSTMKSILRVIDPSLEEQIIDLMKKIETKLPE